ncbi:hypothetical protein M5689_022762 [Euphorbia peplus]|nr:hypothetical protein M5689_022762 [Euphorbia peplus]
MCLPNPTSTLRLPKYQYSTTRRRRSKIESKIVKTPKILQLAITGLTHILRLFSSSSSDITVRYEDGDIQTSVSSVDDLIIILKADYHNAYFVTGNFTSSIYSQDCLFQDPTISFRGTDLYLRNLRLLVPFFDSPSIALHNIQRGADSETTCVLATWELRTYLKFPWKPLICIDGSTTYEVNDEFKVVRHVESWNVSALEAIGQIFTPTK